MSPWHILSNSLSTAYHLSGIIFLLFSCFIFNKLIVTVLTLLPLFLSGNSPNIPPIWVQYCYFFAVSPSIQKNMQAKNWSQFKFITIWAFSRCHLFYLHKPLNSFSSSLRHLFHTAWLFRLPTCSPSSPSLEENKKVRKEHPYVFNTKPGRVMFPPSFFLRIPLVIWGFCGPINILGFFFYFYKKSSLAFW